MEFKSSTKFGYHSTAALLFFINYWIIVIFMLFLDVNGLKPKSDVIFLFTCGLH